MIRVNNPMLMLFIAFSGVCKCAELDIPAVNRLNFRFY